MKTLAKARLLVTRFPYEARFGGEEMHTLHLMSALDQKGYEAFFLGSCPVLLKEFQKKGFETQKVWFAKAPVTAFWLIAFTLLSPLLFLLAGFYLWRARKKWQVDVLYALSFGEKLLMTPWAHFFKMRILWLEHARIGRWLTHNPWKWIYRTWSKWATVIVTSHAMLPHLEGLVKKVIAIPCGVELSPPTALPEDLVAFMRSGFAVGVVSRLTVDKGVDMIARLVHSKPDIRLVFVGQGPLKATLGKQANSKQIKIVSSLSQGELHRFYDSLDVFVLGSTQMDPFGMVAAEAMLAGTPLVVTDLCGISQDLRNGEEALVIPPRFAALDKAIKTLMKRGDLRTKIARQGQAFAKRRYSLDRMVAIFEDRLS